MWRWIAGIGIVFSLAEAQVWEEMELLWEEAEDGEAPLTRLEYFEYYRSHPLCLQQASVAELGRLPGMTISIARALRELLRRYPQLSYAEMCDSIGLTPEQCWVLQQATTLHCLPQLDYSGYVRSSLTAPLLTRVEDSGYVGGFIRHRGWGEVRWRGVQLGAVWDKDAGEPRVADFVSMSLLALPWRGVRCIIGDFRVYAAMGLLSWGGGGWRYPSFGLGEALQWRTELAPWLSTSEYGFLRGIGLQWEPQWLGLRGRVVGWISSVPRSGRVDTAGVVRSVITDGIFATVLQRSTRDRFREFASGGIAELEWAAGRVAIGALGLRYSNPLMTQSRRQFIGREGVLVAAAARWELQDGAIAFECARDARGWWAWHGGVGLRWEGLQLTWAFRSLPDSFRSPYGSIVSRGVAPSNEAGIFLGLAWGRRGHRWQVYGDLFRTQVAPYGMPVPRYGTEIAARWLWRLQKGWEVWFHSAYRSWLEAERSEGGWQILEHPIIRLRTDLLIGLNQRWRWRLRCDMRRRGAPATPASAVLLATGIEGRERQWRMRAWFGVYGVPTAALGFWVYETVAARLPQLHFIAGSGNYGTLYMRWEPIEGRALEVALTRLQRRRPSPLELWGAPIRGTAIGTVSITAEWRL